MATRHLSGAFDLKFARTREAALRHASEGEVSVLLLPARQPEAVDWAEALRELQPNAQTAFLLPSDRSPIPWGLHLLGVVVPWTTEGSHLVRAVGRAAEISRKSSGVRKLYASEPLFRAIRAVDAARARGRR